MNIKYAMIGIAPFYAAAVIFGMITAMLVTFWPDQTGLTQAVGQGSMLTLGVGFCFTLSIVVGLLPDFPRQTIVVIALIMVIASFILVSRQYDYLLVGAALVFVPLFILDRLLGLKLEKA